jgi:hypothetical protein
MLRPRRRRPARRRAGSGCGARRRSAGGRNGAGPGGRRGSRRRRGGRRRRHARWPRAPMNLLRRLLRRDRGRRRRRRRREGGVGRRRRRRGDDGACGARGLEGGGVAAERGPERRAPGEPARTRHHLRRRTRARGCAGLPPPEREAPLPAAGRQPAGAEAARRQPAVVGPRHRHGGPGRREGRVPDGQAGGMGRGGTQAGRDGERLVELLEQACGVLQGRRIDVDRPPARRLERRRERRALRRRFRGILFVVSRPGIWAQPCGRGHGLPPRQALRGGLSQWVHGLRLRGYLGWPQRSGWRGRAWTDGGGVPLSVGVELRIWREQIRGLRYGQSVAVRGDQLDAPCSIRYSEGAIFLARMTDVLSRRD